MKKTPSPPQKSAITHRKVLSQTPEPTSLFALSPPKTVMSSHHRSLSKSSRGTPSTSSTSLTPKTSVIKKIPKNIFTFASNLPKPSPSTFNISRPKEDQRLTKSLKFLPELDPFMSPKLNSITRTEVFSKKFDDESDDRYYKNLLEISTEQDKSLNTSQDFIGGVSSTQFYSQYKKIEKIKEKYTNDSIFSTASTSILTRCDIDNLLPLKMGMFKNANNNFDINVGHYNLGDQYASAFSNGLKLLPKINSLEMSSNRLTSVGAKTILNSLTPRTKNIDFSMNRIGKLGSQNLSRIVRDKTNQLEVLNLEGNRLTDEGVIDLCAALQARNKLKKLDLSNNLMTDRSCEKLAEWLEETSRLEELYLNWNKIRGYGAAQIFAALDDNIYLRVLDISWNALGSGTKSCTAEFAQLMRKNESLLHIDLSYNNFNKSHGEVIIQGLHENHTLYGFHYMGNYGYIDPQGFLVLEDVNSAQPQYVNNAVFASRIKSVKCKREGKAGENNKFCDNCWICGGWNEVQFVWEPKQSDEPLEGPVYVHMSFDNYKAQLMSPTNNTFEIQMMCPPGDISYFFTVKDKQMTAPDQNITRKGLLTVVKDVKIGNKVVDVRISSLNYIHNAINSMMINESYTVLVNTQPRTTNTELEEHLHKDQKKPWHFNNSLFKDYNQDHKALLDECFEFDWQCSKISRIIKKPEVLVQVRELLHSLYARIKDCYKYYAAIGVVGDVWSIPQNAFTDFVNQTNMIDGKTLRLTDVDLKFIATNSSEIRGPRNPERALVRFQFMEILVRLAEDKYMKNNPNIEHKDALKTLINDHVFNVIKNHNSQIWREERFWNEQCDICLKNYLQVIKDIYKKYSGATAKPGEKNFMSLGELHQFCNDSKIFDDNFVDRDANLAFNLSMMTQVDELNFDRVFQMSFVEFLEALARIAEKASFAPFTEKEEFIYPARASQPLHFKLEGLLQVLYDKCCTKDLRDSFRWPKVSIFGFNSALYEYQVPSNKKTKEKRGN